MTDRQVHTHTEQTGTPTVTPTAAPAAAVSHSEVTYEATSNTILQRLIVFIFALIQGLLLLRIVLLLVAAREGNALVSLVYDVSDVFVAPFRGILGQNVIESGATALDVAAIVALVGWTIIELVILGLVRVFRR